MRAALAASLLVVLAGCGSSPGDLLAIQSSGGPANASQTIVVRVDGRASCNRGAEGSVTNSQLLDADAVVRDAQSYAARAQTFPPGPAGGRQFVLRTQDGTVRWYESSPKLPAVFGRAELLMLHVAPALCR